MRQLVMGKTGIMLSELGLGCLFMSRFGLTFENCRQTVLRAIERGVNDLDMAPGYADIERQPWNFVISV